MPAFFSDSRAIPQQRGVAAVEFAVLVFLLLLIAAGLVEFGRGLWYYDALAKGTRDAARYLSAVPAGNLSGESQKAGEIVVEAASAALVPKFTSAYVAVVCTPTPCTSVTQANEVSEISVRVAYPLTLGVLFPFFLTENGTTQTASFALTLRPATSMAYLW